MSLIVPLTPHYRCGADTPWGGDALSRLCGRNIPDPRTGESLEASTLPGMESRLPDGRTLTEAHGGPLPLLLKLLDAREALSVQVHPDDAYAAENEGGKLGKTEAWLILFAQPGAKLVYGLLPGTDVSALTPDTLESRLRWVDVTPGDVLYIPAGTVHAIGAGIVLYEIQQASDVTYRFWDWNRRDANGNARQLHWDKAIAVSRAEPILSPTRGQAEAVPGGTVIRCLRTERFTLDRLIVDDCMALPEAAGFRFVTALCEGTLAWQGESIPFGYGQTFFIEKGVTGVMARCLGEIIVSGEV